MLKYNMEHLNLILIIGSICLNFCSIIFFMIGLFIINKKSNQKLDDINKDISEALTKTLEFTQKEFKANYENHQEIIDWEYDALKKIMQSSSENFNYLAKQQFLNENLLNNVLSSLGFRSRFDESDIEKPKRTYADPPNPVELEGLKIVNGKTEN